MTGTLTPSRFEAIRNDFDIVPVTRELSADTVTPVSAYASISKMSGETFLLESVERGESVGRYSFIGHSPRRTLVLDESTDDPIRLLREELAPLRVFGEEDLPPFFGGAVAWFGYGCARWSETLPDRHPNDLRIPDAKVLFIDNVIVFDHLTQKLTLVANLFTSDSRGSEELLALAGERLDSAENAIRHASIDLRPVGDRPTESSYEMNCTKEQFLDSIASAKEQIAAGEAFQIVLSQRWTTDFPSERSLDLYLKDP